MTLDLGLPGEDGLSVGRAIRARSQVPIVMVTGKGDVVDRVVGLELGADDYITKPFHVREVLARVRAVLRRSEAVAARPAAPGEVLAFGDWVLDVPRRELRTQAGTVCELTTSEFDLLYAFATHPQRPLTRDQIMDLLRGRDWAPTDRSIDNLGGAAAAQDRAVARPADAHQDRARDRLFVCRKRAASSLIRRGRAPRGRRVPVPPGGRACAGRANRGRRPSSRFMSSAE